MSATWEIREADCVEAMAAMDAGSVDAVVCDPPYGLEFMGREWDKLGAVVVDDPASLGGFQTGPNGGNAFSNARVRYGASAKSMQAWHEGWAHEALRVLKPGGHLLAFGGTRTYHRLAGPNYERSEKGDPVTAAAAAAAAGWGTALKPAFEPIVVARKPLIGTVAANWREHGTGALNVDGCRVGTDDTRQTKRGGNDFPHEDDSWTPREIVSGSEHGRWPANVILDPDAAVLLDAQSGELTSGANPTRRGSDKFRTAYGDFVGQEECVAARGGESGGASRFYYVAKASTAERDAGIAERDVHRLGAGIGEDKDPSAPARNRNVHPTVKPIELMRWLIRLVTPTGGLVLDPFTGSGTTGCAAVLEGFRFLGLEREAEYARIARARIGWWAEHPDGIELCRALEAHAERRRIADSGQLGLLDGTAA